MPAAPILHREVRVLHRKLSDVIRTRDRDGCPGALRVHQAADGALARIRLPGGTITAGQLEALAGAAAEFGGGTLELTGRGNLQVRAITDVDAVAEVVAAAGLLPSPRHELVRNIVASPLSGRVGGLVDVRPWVGWLDTAIQTDPGLSALPGRFLFSLDDGSGDVSGLAADAGVQALGDGRVALLLAGRDTGVRLAGDDAVEAMVAVARRFSASRGSAWRVKELDDYWILLDGYCPESDDRLHPTPTTRPRVGWIPQDDGRVTLGAALPLGVLDARQARFVAAVEAPVVITPWRSLLICDLSEEVADTALRVLPGLGLVFDDTSAWLDVSACVGSPGCARSAADVRAEATRAVQAGTEATRAGSVGYPVHYVGCERACGRPPAGQVLVATPDGYRPVVG